MATEQPRTPACLGQARRASLLAAPLLAAPLLAAALLALLPAPVLGADHRCQPVVEDILARLDSAASDIRQIQYSPQIEDTGDDNSRTVGFDAWVRFQSCPGALIVDLTTACRVRQVYTRGPCRFPGVKAYC